MNYDDRDRVLSPLASVDALMLFDEETPIDVIEAIRPDVLANWADYSEDQVVGAREVNSWGGRVHFISLVDGKSSSDIIESIKPADSSIAVKT